MSSAPPEITAPRRSLTARASSLRVVRRLLTGSARLSDLRPSEKAEALICLDQTAAMLDRLAPITKDVEALLVRHENRPEILEAREAQKGAA